MAEIKIQEKKSPIWPWILGIILIALAAWIILENKDDNDDVVDINLYNDTTNNVDTTGIYSGAQNDSEVEVNDFAEFVQSNDTIRNIDESYVRAGFDHLLSAVNAVINEQNINDTGITVQRDSLKNYVDEIKGGTIEQNRENVRKAFVSAADLMQAMQSKNFPDLKSRVDELKKIAQSMRGQNLNQQKEKVKEYFSKSSKALQAMVNREV